MEMLFAVDFMRRMSDMDADVVPICSGRVTEVELFGLSSS
jgi:hypothetical protein